MEGVSPRQKVVTMSLEAKLVIEEATVEMAAELRAIYAPYVAETAVSFEYDVPTRGEFATRIRRVTSRYPWLVARRNGRIVGYAYAGTFKDRRAYDRSVELSIYVKAGCHRGGVGRALYAALEERLARMGITNLYACIAYPNGRDDPYLSLDSVRFHERLGFCEVGRFTDCADKFGRLYSMVWMGKMLPCEDGHKM